MNTTTLNNKEYTLTEGEGGKLTLTPLIKQPEPRTPKAGDVWYGGAYGQSNYLMCADSPDGMLASNLSSGARSHYGFADQNPLAGGDFTYLGKFDEVYVKISDVREALSLRDGFGNNVSEWLTDVDFEPRSGSIIKTYEALLKLNII